MAKTMDFNAVKGSNWYKKGGFDTANKELGIREVRFTKPNGNHSRVIANAIIELENGITLFGTVYLARNGEDLTFGVEQRKYQVEGQDRYVDINVRIPLKVQAFVLNLAEGRMVEGAAQPVSSPSVSSPVANPVDEVTETVAPKQDVDFESMTKEQLMAKLMNQ